MSRITLAVLAFAAIACLLVPATADAHPKHGGPFGIGIILGEPTGITEKYWMGSDQALDFHLGLDGVDNHRNDNFGIYVDYLFHFDTGVNASAFSMPFYLGPGGALVIWDDNYRGCNRFGNCYDGNDNVYLAARLPLGLAFLFTRFGGEAFVELVPTISVIPSFFHFDIHGALGFRYYF